MSLTRSAQCGVTCPLGVRSALTRAGAELRRGTWTWLRACSVPGARLSFSCIILFNLQGALWGVCLSPIAGEALTQREVNLSFSPRAGVQVQVPLTLGLCHLLFLAFSGQWYCHLEREATVGPQSSVCHERHWCWGWRLQSSAAKAVSGLWERIKLTVFSEEYCFLEGSSWLEMTAVTSLKA